MSRENTQLQAQLQDTLRTVSVTRMELEKATQVNNRLETVYISDSQLVSRSQEVVTVECVCVIQRQERFSDCSALLELEKKVCLCLSSSLIKSSVFAIFSILLVYIGMFFRAMVKQVLKQHRTTSSAN